MVGEILTNSWNTESLPEKNKKHQIRHKPGISKHYSAMRNFYNLICLEQWYFSLVWLPTCETYKSFVGDFFSFLSLNWLGLNFWFIAVIRWDTICSLEFFWWLNFADIGGDNQKKKLFWTSWGHKFSSLFMDIRYYSANKNLQPTFFMIFPSQLNGILVRRGVLRICKWQGGSNNLLGFKHSPPPKKKKKSLDQNLTLKMSHTEFPSH